MNLTSHSVAVNAAELLYMVMEQFQLIVFDPL